MSDLITVAVAVYNAEKYLKKCLQSIVNQTYENIEILLVNDGSVDNSLLICNSFADSDKRIKVIDKDNGGLSSSRNKVLELMTGSYLMFVDCDDWIELNMIDYLHRKMCENQLDMAICSGFDHYENTDEVKIVKRKGDIIFDRNQAICDFYSNQNYMFDAIQCKLYKKESIQDVVFKMNRTTDDTLTTPMIINNCIRLGYFDVPLYHYLIRDGSMTRTTYNSHTIDKVLAYYDNIELISSKYPSAFEDLIAKMYSAIITNELKLEILNLKDDYGMELRFYDDIIRKYPVNFLKLTIFAKIYYIISKNSIFKVIMLKLFRKKIIKFLQIKV
ncbi:MAG: glycosyltransferase family 2 protein [Anaerorhabdus sp.]|uniref:glycosyltransferase family 2 protein n=1 Tax=Anaerorhabdus sp. TaxID=1872524 RepID=UPI002FC7DECA